MNPEVFVADRSGRLDRFDRLLLPTVEKALAHWGERGWYDPIVAAAQRLWDGITPDHLDGDAEFVATLTDTLKLTGDPEHATANQATLLTSWVSTFTANHAEHSRGKAAGHLAIRWLTRLDDKVRALHQEVEGQTVPFGTKFEVGGYHLRFPGDPVGPPDVWINCRCLAMSLDGTMTAAAAPEAPTEVPFHGIAAPTDTPSGDGRLLARTGFSHRDLPMPLNYQRGSSHGGDSGPAVTIGRIDSMGLNEDGQVVFGGVISTAFPEASEALQHLRLGSMNGVSVDVDSAKEEYQNLPSPDEFASEAEFVEAMQSVVQTFSSWRISGVTMCAIPAFAEAFISLDTEPEPTLTASGFTVNLVASAAVLPIEWFQDPNLSAPTPFTVMDDGRVFGHVATWGTCHVGIRDRCTTAPHSNTGYAYYRTGAVRTTAGDVPVGHITMSAGHADLRAGAQAAAAHYDNVATAVADVAAGEDIHGIWVAGALRPGVTDEQRHGLKAAALSGDWREIRGNLELVAALAVNVPGFPIPRLGLAASGADQTALVAAGVVTPTFQEVTMSNPIPAPAGKPPAAKAPPHPASPPAHDGDDAVNHAIAAIDDAIDAAVAAINPDDPAAAHLKAADTAIDALMQHLGIPDPDKDGPADDASPSAMAAAVESAVRAAFARRDRLARVRAQREQVLTKKDA